MMTASENATNRGQLEDLSRSLRKMHKVLIDAETKRFGPVGNPFEHLQLVTTHPQFAWLRLLSEFMVELDERLDDSEPIDTISATAFRNTLEQFIGPGPESQPEFRRRYMESLHDSPEIAIVHGALRLSLSELPDTSAKVGASNKP